MSTASIITSEFIRALAPNDAAFTNARKISSHGDFLSNHKTADETLIFGECRGM